jgi:hypothetical protein
MGVKIYCVWNRGPGAHPSLGKSTFCRARSLRWRGRFCCDTRKPAFARWRAAEGQENRISTGFRFRSGADRTRGVCRLPESVKSVKSVKTYYLHGERLFLRAGGLSH